VVTLNSYYLVILSAANYLLNSQIFINQLLNPGRLLSNIISPHTRVLFGIKKMYCVVTNILFVSDLFSAKEDLSFLKCYDFCKRF